MSAVSNQPLHARAADLTALLPTLDLLGIVVYLVLAVILGFLPPHYNVIH